MSPSERSTTFGTSSLATNCEASMYPGDPGWIRSLPDCVRRSGSQPISSSEPEQISRSALRTLAMRLGRASMRCGSCFAVVAEKTETLSPPSSCASAAHSGSHANTFTAQRAGPLKNAVKSAAMIRRNEFIRTPLEPMSTVRAQADDVLQEDLVVGLAHARVVARQLQPDAAELARAPVDHQ